MHIVVSGGSLRGFMISQTLLCGSYAGLFFPQFLRQTVSALWAFILFNSIALLKTIMRDAGESTSPGQGAETSLRWGSSPNTGLILCGSYAGVMRDGRNTSLSFIMREIMREVSNSMSSVFVRRHHGKKMNIMRALRGINPATNSRSRQYILNK